MFGHKAYSERAFATIGTSVQVTESLTNYYFSRFGFVTSTGDTPSQELYDPRVMQPLTFQRSIINGDYMSGLAFARGEIVLDNSDGGLDNFVLSHSFDGRDVSVSLGATEFGFSDFEEIFSGKIESVEANELTIRFNIRDKLLQLDQPIQPNTYSGTGGVNGSTDLTDKPKPLAFGRVRNVPAILVDATNLVYQVHDGSVNDITAVYDRGVSLTKVSSTATPTLGEYQNNSSVGRFTLGGAPDGLITADVEGDNSTSYITKTGEIVQRILIDHGGLSSSELATTMFTELNSASTATVGIWLDTQEFKTSIVVDELLRGMGGYGSFNRFGVFEIGRFDLPVAPATVGYDESNILTISRTNLTTIGYPPAWQARVGYQKNYVVQTDIAGSVPAAHRAFISADYRLTNARNLATKNRFANSQNPPPVPTYFENTTDAEVEAGRLIAMTDSPHQFYEITTKAHPFTSKLNDVVMLNYPRWELKNGKLGRIVSIDTNAASNEVRLVIFV